MKKKLASVLVASALIVSPVFAKTASNGDPHAMEKKTGDVRNTSQNVRDRNDTVLPEDQSEQKQFLERTAAIRKDVVNDSGMSSTAKNVKIITNDDGNVILRGPVVSRQEKDRIESIANRHRGDRAVFSYIDVEKAQ